MKKTDGSRWLHSSRFGRMVSAGHTRQPPRPRPNFRMADHPGAERLSFYAAALGPAKGFHGITPPKATRLSREYLTTQRWHGYITSGWLQPPGSRLGWAQRQRPVLDELAWATRFWTGLRPFLQDHGLAPCLAVD